DGFPLWDLVGFDRKHNEANREDNRDGADDNACWNSGHEGPTDDAAIVALRLRRARNLIVQLLFSAGTPMPPRGDQPLRTQGGNNNAYCQDNEISWIDWRLLDANRAFFAFVRGAIAFSRKYPVLQRRAFFAEGEVRWLGPDGRPPAWGDPNARTIGYLLDGAH